MNYLSFNEYAFILNDVILEICKYLGDTEKTQFLSVTKHTDTLKDKIFYDDLIIVDKISQLWYFDKFTKIIVIFDIGKIPKNIKELYLGNFLDKHINAKIPAIWKNIRSYGVFTKLLTMDMPYLTHLYFGTYYNYPIYFLPQTITHLSFGNQFNEEVECIPFTVTHLYFGKNFDKPIRKLPNVIVIGVNLFYFYHINPDDYPKLRCIERFR